MTRVILGGSGQLGRALQMMFLSNEEDFAVPARSEVDITKKESVSYLATYKPSALINCAAWTNVDGAEKDPTKARAINVEGARLLAEFAREARIPFIQISTDYVFSGIDNQPYKVDSETNPANAYGITKLDAEKIIGDIYPQGSYIIRTAWLYSPWGKNFVKTMITRALSRETSDVVTDQIGQPTSAIDLSYLVFEVIKRRPKVGTYHGTNRGQASWFEFAQEVYQLANADSELVMPTVSANLPTLAQRPKYSVLDHSEWKKAQIEPLRHWKIALVEAFPLIMAEVEKELTSGKNR